MSGLNLTFACGRYDRMQPLRDGDITIEGVDLNVLQFDAGREIFDRMVGKQEFDLSELSASEYISLLARGDCPFVAIPVFPSRVFRHGFIFINRRSGIRAAKDLEHKRIGVPLYTQTAAIWVRGHLADEYGVDLDTIQWVQGSVEAAGSHGSPHAPPLLKPARIVPNETQHSLSELLERGDIDAMVGSRRPTGMGQNPDIVRLFPDYPQIERDYFRRTGIFPIMHLVAMRRALCEAHPWLAASLYRGFIAAKQLAMQRLRFTGATSAMLPWQVAELEELAELFGPDHWPYGVEANRPTLETLVRYMVAQHFISAPMPIEALFTSVGGDY